jgi:orotate phosphoribosyltransferase
MLNDKQVLEMFRSSGAILNGHFSLTSGFHSDEYVQSSLLFSDPKIAMALAFEIAAHFHRSAPNCIVGPTVGGIVLSFEVARLLGARAAFAERLQGVMQLARGFEVGPGDRVLVVDDVVITGDTTLDLLDVLAARGAEVVGMGALLDGSTGEIGWPVPFHALARKQYPVYAPQECPQCSAGVPLKRPRHGRL